MKVFEWMKNSYNKKILICNNLKNGLRLIRNANKNNISRFNVSVKSLRQLAEEIVISDMAKRGELKEISFLDNYVCAVILNKIITDNKELITFIPEESLCSETALEVLRIINMIRMNNTKEAYNNSKDIKIKEIKSLIAMFENKLYNEDKFDYCRLLKRATEILKNNNEYKDTYFAILEDLEITIIEKEFIELISGNNCQKLSYTFDNSNNSFEFFKSYGIANEVKYVIEDIRKKNIPLGQVNIFYTNDIYINYIRSAFGAENIACNIISPYSGKILNTTGFILGILDWAENNYLLKNLEGNMFNPYFKVKGTSNAFNAAIKKNIGWGMEQYSRYIDYVKNNANEYTNMEIIGFFEKLDDIFKCYISPLKLFDDILDITNEYINSFGPEKRTVIQSLKEQRAILAELEDISYEDALKNIREIVENITASDCESTDSVSAIKSGEINIIERKHNYVIGLANKLFLESENESPVLSDSELKEYIDGSITLSSEKNSIKKQNFLKTLNTVTDSRFIFGYSVYDTVELKPYSPSSLYIELMEMPHEFDFENKKSFGYQNVINDNIIVHSENVLNGGDYNNTEKEPDYKNISATSLSTMLECPIKYYYQYIKKIPEFNYIEPDASKWLDAFKKGNLYHKVLELYINKISNCDCIKDFNESLFNNIFNKQIKEFSNIYPCYSEERKNSEIEEYREKLAAFLKEFHKDYCNGERETVWHIKGCEINFENFKYVVSDEDKKAEIEFNGKIDRVDYYTDAEGKTHFRVIDYKTGKRKNMDEKIKNNHQIQHILYSMVMKEENTEIDEALYVFPEDLECINISNEKLTDFPDEVKKIMADVIIYKKYEKQENTNCKFCSYSSYCKEAK